MLFLQIRIWMSIHDAIPAQAELVEKLKSNNLRLSQLNDVSFI